jgi:hypothetical protein
MSFKLSSKDEETGAMALEPKNAQYSISPNLYVYSIPAFHEVGHDPA